MQVNFSWTKLIFLSLFGFLSAMLYSGLATGAIWTTPKTYVLFFMGAPIMYLVYLAVGCQSYRRIVEIVLSLLIFYVFIVSLVAIYQHVVLHIYRPRSIVGYVNTVARYIELFLPILLMVVFYKNTDYIKRTIILLTLVILAVGLFITYTRGAWIAVFITVSVILLLERYYNWLLICYSAGLTAVLVDKYGLSRLSSIFILQHQDNVQRLYGWATSIRIIQDNLLVGVGLKNFQHIYPLYMPPEATEKLAHAHNTLLVFATEAGVVTAFFFLVFIVSLLFFTWSHCRYIDSELNRRLVIGMSLSILALMIHGMVDYAFNNPGVWLIFMFMGGYMLGLLKSVESSSGTVSLTTAK